MIYKNIKPDTRIAVAAISINESYFFCLLVLFLLLKNDSIASSSK